VIKLFFELSGQTVLDLRIKFRALKILTKKFDVTKKARKSSQHHTLWTERPADEEDRLIIICIKKQTIHSLRKILSEL
jgi:hypothetical protein